jgi:hypothetical protein
MLVGAGIAAPFVVVLVIGAVIAGTAGAALVVIGAVGTVIGAVSAELRLGRRSEQR